MPLNNLLIYFVAFVSFAIIVVELWPKKLLDKRIGLSDDKGSGPLILYSLVFESALGFLTGSHWNNPLAILVNGYIILIVTGFMIRLKSRTDLGEAYSYRIGKISSQLVTNRGFYKTIRHPAYLGTLLYAVGILVLFANWGSVFGFVLFLIVLLHRINLEENFLSQHFQEYSSYRKNTWRLIPYIY